MEGIHEGLVINDHYKLVKNLGKGSYGNIWLSTDITSNVNVAIKFYSSEKDFPDWGLYVKYISEWMCPNLVKVFSSGIWQGYPYIVMEYYEDGDAFNLVGKLHPCSKDERLIWTFVHDVASGLAFLHDKNFFHQDIKLSNILMNQGHFAISDFETLCRVEIFSKSRGSSTTLVDFDFPNRFSVLNYRSVDIWFLGVSIYELATGELIFVNGDVKDIPQLSPQWSLELRSLLQRCNTDNSNLQAGEIVLLARQMLQDNSIEKFYSFKETLISYEQKVELENDVKWKNEDTLAIIETQYALTCKRWNYHLSPNVEQCLKSIRIARNNIFYGIIDTNGDVIVDYKYSKIEPFEITYMPGPGPYSGNPYSCFIGAFFHQGNNVGFLRIKEDGTIEEFGKCSSEEFHRLCCLT